MKEVACRVLEGFFQNLQRNHIAPARFIQGSRYPLAHLRNKHERIEWSEFCLLMGNARQIWTNDELIELGGEFLRSPFLRAYQIIARLLFSTRELIHYTNSEFGSQMFSCVHASERDVAPNVVEIDMTLADGYEVDETYFLVARGGLKYMPCMMRFPPAEIDMTRLGRTTRYRMTFTPGGGTLSSLRKLLVWPSTVLGAARELREANRVLQARYEELERTRDALALRSTQLEVANRITMLIHGNLDLEHTVQRVAEALVGDGGFEAAEMALTVGAPYDLSRTAGAHGQRPPDMTLPVESRHKVIGELSLWIRAGHDGRERKELLDQVMPSIATTVDEALTHTMLQESRQHLERRVEERTAELSRASQRLARTLEEVTEAKQARDRIFANINHEIRTPLSIVKSASAELRRVNATLERGFIDERLESIDFATNRLLRIVDELLDLAAGKEGKLSLQRVRFDLVKHLRVVVSAWARVAEKESIALVLEAPETKPVYIDQAKIDRAVSNLLSNAIKYTPTGGRVILRLSCSAGELRISVEDSGRGLAPGFEARVFGRFEKGDAPLRGGAGSGIGLSLVKEVIELHGGSVSAGNAPGGGARFELVLPDKEESGRAIVNHALGDGNQAAMEAAEYRTLDPRDYNLGVPERKTATLVQPTQPTEVTILVAEDDPELRESLGRLLGGKFRVLLAENGAQALELARTHLPDLLVSDVDMPVMDGIELLRQFQAIPNLQMPSAVLLTAMTGLKERLVGLEAGAVDYVSKPFEPDEVLARVESQLSLRRRALEAARKENLSALGTMVKGLMHELRNPANGLVHAVRLLREILPAEVVAKDSAVDELMQVAELCSTQIESMCVDLVGANGRGDPLRKLVPLKRVIDRAGALVSGFVRDVELSYEAGYEGEVWCSEQLLAQVLANLIKNGAQAAGKNGWVKIASRVEKDNLIVEVTDSGPGVPPQMRQRIFELFFTTKPAGQGSGIGLPMSRQVIERHGGVLEVRDGPNGTVFYVSVPLTERAAATAAAQTTVAPRAAAGS